MNRFKLIRLVAMRQYKFNRMMFDMNRLIREDNTWHGRFFVGQYKRIVHKYKDGSGAAIKYFIKIYDKKTKQCAIAYIDDYNTPKFTEYILERAVNKFITEMVLSQEDSDVRIDTTIYSLVDIPISEYTLIQKDPIFR